jgi:HEAT repeat protein
MSEPTSSEPPKEKPSPGVDVSDDVSFGRTLFQFFVIPAFVVAVSVSLFFFFAWMVSDDKTGVDYLHEIRTGSASRRWQAAFELSKIMTMDKEKRRMEGLVPEMVKAFEDAEKDDPRVRHYLAISLGQLGDSQAGPALVGALDDPDPTTRFYSCWALGNLRDRDAAAPLLDRVDDDDQGVRKMAVYALGAIGDKSAVPRLRVALTDPERDVSWNAAVALAKLGDDGGESVLLQMLDPDFLDGIPDMDPPQKLLAMESAIRAAALLKSEALGARLREIGASHPNLALRKIALEALQSTATDAAERPPSP